jgi:hypothetical protein
MFDSLNWIEPNNEKHALTGRSATVPGIPTITKVLPLNMGFLVYFTPPEYDGGSPILNYGAVDPSQHWISSWSGSPHILLDSPLFVQGTGAPGSSAQLQILAQNAVGWSNASSQYAAVTISGTQFSNLSDPCWWYNSGTFYGNGDFSQYGGDANAIPPAWGGTGDAPNANDIEVDWQSVDITCVSGPGCVKLYNPVQGNWAPCITGYTQTLYSGGSLSPLLSSPSLLPSSPLPLSLILIFNSITDSPIWQYWTCSFYPTYDSAYWTVKWETSNDVVASNIFSLSPFVTSPVSGVFTKNQWNQVYVPFGSNPSIFNLSTNGVTGKKDIYKMVIQQGDGNSGLWYADNLGFSNSINNSATSTSTTTSTTSSSSSTSSSSTASSTMSTTTGSAKSSAAITCFSLVSSGVIATVILLYL